MLNRVDLIKVSLSQGSPPLLDQTTSLVKCREEWLNGSEKGNGAGEALTLQNLDSMCSIYFSKTLIA